MQTRHQYSKDVPYTLSKSLSKSNVEENKLNSIDHTFQYLLLGSNDKQLNTLDPRRRLS
jgi:hypothetical protein